MDITNRKWWIRTADNEEGPIDEDSFQDRLRAGLIPLNSKIKSNMMDGWQPLLAIVSTDETFRRPSTIPPMPPRPSSKAPPSPEATTAEQGEVNIEEKGDGAKADH
jgi:hypothetical protein